jgi:septal ring factor EnvC (AmiA/AmiB activator)
VTVSGVVKWAAVGLLVTAPAALLGYLSGAVAHGGLAAWAAIVLVAMAMRLDRRLTLLGAAAKRSATEMDRMREQNGQLRASLKDLKAENAALKRQVAKAQSAHDDKIALSVQRMKEAIKAEVGGLAAVVRDSEVETGLAALNRYTALATHPAVLLGDPEPPAGDAVE